MQALDIMEQHLNKLRAMADELDAIEVAIPKEIKVMVLFMNLPKSYQTLFNTLESSKVEDCTWQNVNTSLFNEEFMRKEKVEISQVGGETTLATTSLMNHQPRQDKSNDICKYCGDQGH
jgi:hypothetical protein